MRIEFNGNSFSADMNGISEKERMASPKEIAYALRKNKPLLFGTASLIVALASLPFGFLSDLCAELVRDGVIDMMSHWILVTVAFAILTVTVSLALGVLSTVFFVRSYRRTCDAIGLICSGLACAICVLSAVLTVIGLVR